MGMSDRCNGSFVGLVAKELLEPLVETARSNFPEDGVDQCGGAGSNNSPGKTYRLIQGSVRGDTHRQQLMGANPQGIKDGWIELVQWAVNTTRQDGVVSPLAAEGAVAQFRGKSGVAFVQAVVADSCREDKIRIRVLGGNGPEHLKSHQPGGIGTAGALGRRVFGKAALRCPVALTALSVPLAAAPATSLPAAALPAAVAACAGPAHSNTMLSSEVCPRTQSAAVIIFLPEG
jgi:hypothetical protein